MKSLLPGGAAESSGKIRNGEFLSRSCLASSVTVTHDFFSQRNVRVKNKIN